MGVAELCDREPPGRPTVNHGVALQSQAICQKCLTHKASYTDLLNLEPQATEGFALWTDCAAGGVMHGLTVPGARVLNEDRTRRPGHLHVSRDGRRSIDAYTHKQSCQCVRIMCQ